MNIISYLNDPKSIIQTLDHLSNLLSEHTDIIKKNISKQNILTLKFGELDNQGNFLEFKTPKGFKDRYTPKKQITSELIYFDTLSRQDQFDSALIKLCRTLSEYNRKHPMLWSDKRSFLGINILIPLAVKCQTYIPALIHFLSSTDTHKEKCLSEDLDRIFEAHPWSTPTLELLAARATIIEGKYGQKHVKELLSKDKLYQHLQNDLNQNILLEKLTEFCLLNYAEHQGETSPKASIQRTLSPFKGLSDQFDHKCQFLKKSFVDNFPHYLPSNPYSFNGHIR